MRVIVRFTKSTRRHRIGRTHIQHVMNTTEPEATAPGDSGQPRLRWLGPDDRGLELEVIAVVLNDDTLLVIHAMPTALRGGQP